MRHWRLRKVFVIFPLSLYHKMMEPEFSCRASDSKSRILYSTPGFLLFLLASYFTMKGMEADLKHHFGFSSNTIFYGSDRESVTPIVVIPKKTLLCALQCHLSRWLECISNTIWFWNQDWIYSFNCLCNFLKMYHLCILRQSRDGLKVKKRLFKYNNTSLFSQTLFLSFNLLWQPTDVTSL